MSDWSPFIGDQQWSLLGEFAAPQQYLNTEQFRPGRAGAGLALPGAEPQRDPWLPIADRFDVLRNTLELPDRGSVDLSRLVITTDAGIGKSVAVDWLRAGTFQPQLTRRQHAKARGGHARLVDSTGWMAFVIPPRVLREGSPEQVTQRLRDFMVHEVHGKIEDQGAKRASCYELVERHRRTGRLLLLFDGLDQMGDCEALARAINSPAWSDCHLVIAGRPYALQRDWHALFNDRRWRFIRVEEFSAEQQSRYLGQDRAGTPKIDKIPDEARAILTVPRVLYYIRELPDKKLAALKSAADVYYLAIYELIKRGMEQSVAAREMACDGIVPTKPQDRAILKTFQLLALIALDMVANKIRVATTDAAGNTVWHLRPNFYRVKRGAMTDFLERLEFRFRSTDFGRDWRALSALNTVLTHAVFDADVEGLVEIEFRNRSLQEFLAAYLLAQHGIPDHPPRSGERATSLPLDLGQCIFLPFEPETEDYYYVWQFLANMPADAVREDIWLESVAPLYLPAAQDQAGRWVAKRSNEMLFRTWTRVDQLCEQQHPRALAIREGWWSEFELTILAGGHGKQARRRAGQFQQSFLDMPGGTFT
ncbi:MAG: hypothetical protein ABI614_22005, partial [Planctomycetota bacterium]